MNSKILFRKNLAEEGEFDAAVAAIGKESVIESRSLIKPGDTVVCRYSALPYYEELERDVSILGGSLINSRLQHNYVANFWNWYEDLEEFTPKSYGSLQDLSSVDGPFVLKGCTNSRKHRWNTHMFAKSYVDAVSVSCNLMDDPFIGEQGIVFRKYEKLASYGVGINNLPISKEFRLFVFNGEVIAKGFYWANQPEIIEQYNPNADEIPINFIDAIINRVGNKINFYVIDIAQKASGEWIVIELNDGQMSGLSCIDPIEFYKTLRKYI